MDCIKSNKRVANPGPTTHCITKRAARRNIANTKRLRKVQHSRVQGEISLDILHRSFGQYVAGPAKVCRDDCRQTATPYRHSTDNNDVSNVPRTKRLN